MKSDSGRPSGVTPRFLHGCGDDDEEQIRMNETAPSNPSAALQKPALLQGRAARISYRPAENAAPTWLRSARTRREKRFLHRFWCDINSTRDNGCRGTFSHIWKQSEEAQRNSFLVLIRGALCPQRSAAILLNHAQREQKQHLQSCCQRRKEQKKNHTLKTLN